MITITVTYRLERGSFRPTRIRCEGHADKGRELRCVQVCAATSMWNRAFADHLEKVHWLKRGLTDLRLSKGVSPEVAKYIVRGYTILADEVASDNVQVKKRWTIPVRGPKSRKLATTRRKERQ